ncbi:MAG TPA: acyl-homoserine-lactone synthase [Methylocella sp.]|nr:acyl-homoserine-lactone synthase [Methylocella sp.]
MTVIEDARCIAEDVILREMFEERKRVFVDLLKWDVPVLVDQYEIDQFDTEDAAYLVITGENGRHRASARLLRTDRPHLLDTVFSELCEGSLPTGPTIMEISRFCLSRRLSASERRVARNKLVTALADHALQQGITAYTGIAEMDWFQQIIGFGWKCYPLGISKSNGSPPLVALRIDITDETPSRLRDTGIYLKSDFHHLPNLHSSFEKRR